MEIDSHFAGDERIVTRIVDNGRGIPPKLRRKIFGRFVRLGRELERAQAGTGLGLFIVRTLVRRLQGSITVRDRADKLGTVFEVTLPARRPPPVETPPADSQQVDVSASPAGDRIDSRVS